MSGMSVALTVLGLAAFEVISSIDNAVINAEVLGTIRDPRVKRFFVTWGILFAIFAVRGFLPLLIVYAANADIGIVGAFTSMFSGDVAAKHAIEASSPYLMTAGGMFLSLLFVYWLFVEEKEFGLPHEEILMRVGQVWFYCTASLILFGVLYAFHRVLPRAETGGYMLAATIGFVAFFLANGFKEHAEAVEARLKDGDSSVSVGDWSKVMFLEVIDLTFSVDGVVGAFAFTTVVPLILIGNGVGAIVVRQLTLGNIDRIKRYAYLKNGAMYSVGMLSAVMVAEGMGAHVPVWVSPVATFACIGLHMWLSVRKNRMDERLAESARVQAPWVGVTSRADMERIGWDPKGPTTQLVAGRLVVYGATDIIVNGESMNARIAAKSAAGTVSTSKENRP